MSLVTIELYHFSDLSVTSCARQVSRLRGELCEAEARAQSTQQDLTAVTQEIELLRQR
jgi:hypothetical protein